MAEVDETRLGLLVSRVGDNGSGNLSRDFQKLISETQTLASEHSSLLSEKLWTPEHSGILCRGVRGLLVRGPEGGS